MGVVHSGVLQISHVHGDKTGLFFLYVQKLDIAFLSEFFEGKVGLKTLFGNVKLVVLDCEEWPDASTTVSVNLDFFLHDILDYRDLVRNFCRLPREFQSLDQITGRFCKANPVSIQKDLGLKLHFF
mgnify:CR=1 FL=1